MKIKLLNSNYDKETGISTVTIRTRNGEFTGTSKLHEEDRDIESSFAGCRYAEAKALVKSLKAKNKERLIQLKVLENLEKELKSMKYYNPYSLEACRLRRKIYEIRAEYEEQKALLYNPNTLKSIFDKSSALARKLQSKKCKKE